MNNITNVQINTSKLSSIAQKRSLRVEGDDSAKFLITIVSSSTTTTYYNFNTNVFTSDFTTQNILKQSITAGSYSTDIFFPASTSATYTVQVLPDPEDNTKTYDNRGAFLKTISQVGNTTVTLSLASRSNPNNYKSFPSDVVLTGNAAGGSASVNLSYLIENAETDAGGFGLFFNNDTTLSEGSIYFTTTETVDGATSSSKTFVVDDITDIGIGSQIVSISGGGSLTGSPTVTSIKDKTIELNTAQTFPDGNTLTFVAVGPNNIFNATGCKIKVNNFSFPLFTKVVTTVRAGGSSTTVNVNGTYGIPGGSTAQFFGNNVDNSSDNDINVVTASSSAGSFTCDTAQSLTTASKLDIVSKDSSLTLSKNVTTTGSMIVNAFPAVNKTINIDVDTFLTPGVSGS